MLKNFLKSPRSICFTILAVWVIGIIGLPMVQDEAYYFWWGRNLNFGYFDHPPMVAYVSALSQWFESPVIIRLGNLIVSSFLLASVYRLLRLCLKRPTLTLPLALTLTFLNLFGLIAGIITTPDTVLMLCWTWCLIAVVYAFDRHPAYWLLAGVATGLGLLSKYTMLLIGVVFLAALILEKPRQLRTPWPYLGGMLAFLIFSVNIYWNSQNDWMTFRFQLRHGFSMERPQTDNEHAFPAPQEPELTDHEYIISVPFLVAEEKEEEEVSRWYDRPLKSLNRYLGFYGSQIGLWGGLAPLMLFACFHALRRRNRKSVLAHLHEHVAHIPLLTAAATLPLLIFGLIALFSKVEANWSAMYLIGAGALLAPLLLVTPKLVIGKRSFSIRAGACLNLALVILLVLHTLFGIFPIRAHKDRLLKETYGYNLLGEFVDTLDMPVFAETYQLVAMLNHFHSKSSASSADRSFPVQQWPGLTRASHYTFGQYAGKLSFAELQQYKGFYLITHQLPVKIISGYKATDLQLLAICKKAGLQILTGKSFTNTVHESPTCNDKVKEWYFVRYELL